MMSAVMMETKSPLGLRSTDGGHDSEYGDAEKVHTPRQSHHSAGKGKGDGAERFKNEPGNGHGKK